MKKITVEDRKQAAAFEVAKPKLTGSLHERMKFVLAELDKAREADPEFDQKYNQLTQGIYDLRTEVKFTVPAKPPFGSRDDPRRTP